MRSLAQIAASRANGVRSRGPITEAGKRHSSRNAVRHGLHSKSVLADVESSHDYATLLRDHLQKFAPANLEELAAVRRMAACACQIRQIWALEKRLFDSCGGMSIAEAFSHLAKRPELDLLSRFESRLHRAYCRAFDDLAVLRSARTASESRSIERPSVREILNSRHEPGKSVIPNELAAPARRNQCCEASGERPNGNCPPAKFTGTPKMKAMTGRAQGRIQGDDLIAEVLRNMSEGLFRIRHKTIIPAIYRLYLNPDDFEPFRDIVPFVASEISAALDEQLASLNGVGAKKRLGANVLEKIGISDPAEKTEYVRAPESWTVEIYPDLDGKLQPGEIEVYSELGTPQKPEYGGGSMTRRIFPRRADPDPASESTRPAAASASSAPPPEVNFSSSPQDDGTKGRAFAYIRYKDQDGEHTFEMTKTQVVIGRGGRSYWVDLKLETLPDVSREHCRIRREPETGRFTIEDVSQFGTAVNGKPVGQNQAADIPKRATISLAGVIDLGWEAA